MNASDLLAPPAAVAPAATTGAPCTATIVVAEDEPVIRDLIVSVLRDAGYTVHEAVDGQDALELLFKLSMKETVDILISDVMMPRMTGTELASKTKSLFPRMKVLFHTAYPKSLPVSEGVDAPAVHYIQKPSSMADLQQKVQEILQGGSGAAPAAPDTLLVIDDEEEILNTIGEVLGPQGYRLYSATSPRQGILLYAAHWRSIQLVLLDYKMPEMHGDVVLQRLRRVNPAVQVLLISGHNDLVRDKFGGPNISCLWKPFQLEDLSARVRSLVDAVKEAA